MSVTVGGVDLTSNILMETFTAEVGSRDNITTCSFDIRDETKVVDVKSGALVIVTATVTISPSAPVATVVWRGYVGNIDWSFDGAANIITVDCQSANCLLDQKAYRNKAALRTTNNRTRGNEVVFLLSNSTASEGASPIVYNASKIHNATAATLDDDLHYGGKTLREALEHFCKNAYNTKMQFWVDTSGELNIARVGKDINLIANWEFQLPTGAATTATSWTYTGTPTRRAIAGQNSDGAGAPIAGSEIDYGLKVDDSTESAGQEISGITAGKRYYFSAAIKNLSANRARILLRFRASSGGVFLTPTTTITTTTVGSWVRVEQVVTAPATATHLEVRLGYSGTTSGSVYYDNLQLLEETASFGISDAPDNTTTFAPLNYQESLDASAIINAVAIKGGETKKGSNNYTTWYREYAPSLAYFGRVYGSFIDDSSVTNTTKADRAADEIFSESAMPVREGTYTISSDRLGYTVPVAGTYQIFELSRMPAARQVTINRIEGLSILPYGNGEIVYEIQFGSQKGNLASALATVGSALIGTAKPRLGSTAFEHNLQQSGYVSSSRTLSDPQVTGVAAEVESPSSMPAANTPISIIKKNSTLTVAQNLPDLSVYAAEFPEGTLVMLKPDAADPHISNPTLYRSDGATSWTVATAATILADATSIGQLQHGILTADAIFAGSIDASVIDVTNLNATNIKTGALTIDPSFDANAITSTNFTVTNTGSVTAKDLTIGSTTSTTNSLGNEVSGFIYARPNDNVTSAQFRVVADASNNLTKSVTGITSAGAGANVNCTINATAHPFAQGQFVWFTGATGAGASALNGITEALPAQVISTTTNAFIINYYLAIGAITGGTVTGGKRLSVVAPSGLFVYQNDSAAGFIAAGSLALGSPLTKLGKGSTATLADGEIGFLNATSPRYTSGANLYSDDGGGNLNTSGNLKVGGTLTAGAIVSNSDVTLTGTVINQRASATADVWLSSQTGDSVNRFLIEANGGMFWGSGSATRDTNLYRSAADTLKTDDSLEWAGGSGRLGSVGNIDATAIVAQNISLSGTNGLRHDEPATTTQTSSAAIWVTVSGTNRQLRRNSSSARYKTNIVDADEVVLEAARKVKPRHYESTIADEGGATRLGFIAEEIHDAGLTHAVGYDEEGKPETIDPTALIAALWHRVSDLEDRLKELEK